MPIFNHDEIFDTERWLVNFRLLFINAKQMQRSVYWTKRNIRLYTMTICLYLGGALFQSRDTQMSIYTMLA